MFGTFFGHFSLSSTCEYWKAKNLETLPYFRTVLCSWTTVSEALSEKLCQAAISRESLFLRFIFFCSSGHPTIKSACLFFLHSAARWLALLPLLETSDF